jgi:integrase
VAARFSPTRRPSEGEARGHTPWHAFFGVELRRYDDGATGAGVSPRRAGSDGTRWAYRYRVGGRGSKRVQRGGFASEQAAAEALERALEQSRREQGLVESPTLAEFVEVYLAEHEGEPETTAKLRWLLQKAVCAFGEKRLSDLRSPAVAAWRMTIPAGHRFEARQALRQLLARAVSWGLLDVNPAKLGVENPQRRFTEKRPFESWAELDALATALGPRHGPMIIFAAATGLRPGEWLALERRDVDREAQVVYVRRTLRNGRIKTPKTEVEPSRGSAAGGRARSPRRAAAARPGVPAPVFVREWRLLRPPQRPQPQLEAGTEGVWNHAASTRLRSAAHVRDLRASCRHLHVRPLPVHGNQSRHDRPPLAIWLATGASTRSGCSTATRRPGRSTSTLWTLGGR